jgi:hypothetical protein
MKWPGPLFITGGIACFNFGVRELLPLGLGNLIHKELQKPGHGSRGPSVPSQEVNHETITYNSLYEAKLN